MKNETISYTCTKHKVDTHIVEGLNSLVCSVPGCFKEILFNKDIKRRPHESDAWEKCPANTPVHRGYAVGTTRSSLYEIRVDVPEEVIENPPEDEIDKNPQPTGGGNPDDEKKDAKTSHRLKRKNKTE
jgi:hypothetical protein